MGKKARDPWRECAICKTTQGIERHHVFFGSDRKMADKYGLVIDLCYEHHRGEFSPHHNRELDLQLKRHYQQIFEAEHGHEMFMKLFGRNYL